MFFASHTMYYEAKRTADEVFQNYVRVEAHVIRCEHGRIPFEFHHSTETTTLSMGLVFMRTWMSSSLGQGCG